MSDIDRLPESERPDLHPRDISVRSCIYREVLPMLGPDIETHMIVVGAKLAEIRGQAHGNPQRVAEIMLRIFGGGEQGRRRLRCKMEEGDCAGTSNQQSETTTVNRYFIRCKGISNVEHSHGGPFLPELVRVPTSAEAG